MDKGNYDIIIAGAGLSGLTLALELARRPFFQNQKVLLIDRDNKEKNDRTWCFWATDEENIPPVVFKTWNKSRFWGKSGEIPMQLAPFRYRMVRGIDFYNWAKTELSNAQNIQRLKADISAIDSQTGTVHTNQGNFKGARVFNSALTTLPLLPEANAQYPRPPLSQISNDAVEKGYTWLLQHFKGWVIETTEAAFDPDTVTFMDYRLEQQLDTRFVYVLPFSETRALVEFTVFSPELCSAQEYENALNEYIHKHLNINQFKVIEEEFGVIPMTDYPLSQETTGLVLPIGTVGGFVKASSGYAFKRTQRKIRAFVDAWERTGTPDLAIMRSPKAFRVFDSIMLRVLGDRLLPGHILFSRLFQKLKAPLVFRFLDEDANFAEIMRLLQAPPALPFLKAALRRLGRLFKV